MRFASFGLTTLLCCLPLASAGPDPQPPIPTLAEAWSTPAELEVPESVCHDPERGVLYVANISGTPAEKNGQGFIARLGRDGTIDTPRWITGLNAPKGMGIVGSTLYVTDIDHVVAIDIATAEVSTVYPVEGAGFLNDIAVAGGAVYISDSAGSSSAIHRIIDGELETWLAGPEIARPNGLYAEADRLIVGNSGDGQLKAVAFETKQVTVLAEVGSGIDGLEADGTGGYFISDWSGRTSWVSPAGEVHSLLDTTPAGVNAADLEYVAEQRLLLVPTFFDNRVVAYTVK
jgi:hypothetical protein